jgi:hypothetical protein
MPPTDDAGRASRRRVLRSGGAALATGLTASLAGCPLGIPPLSGRIDFGRVDAPGPATDDYADWVPTKSAFETDNDGIGHVWHAQPRRLSESVFGPGSLPVGITTGRLDYFGVGYRTCERALGVAALAATVVTADVDPATVAEAVADTGYEERPTYRGYTVFGRSDLPRVVAVDDGVLVYARSSVDNDAAFAALVDRAGSRPANWLGISAFGGFGAETPDALDSLLTSSISCDFDGDAVY